MFVLYESEAGVKSFWSVLLVTVILAPALFILLVLLEAQFPALDGFTLSMPVGMRSMVSQMALRQAGNDAGTEKKIYRAVTLDPTNEVGWGRLCARSASDDPATAVTICDKAVSLRATDANFNGLGMAQERLGDDCAAEQSFTSALSMKRDKAVYQKNMGRAALRCGHIGAAVGAFEVAESLDARAAGDDSLPVLREDREYLMLAYTQVNEAEKASVLCVKVHPAWASCVCELGKSGVECSDGAARGKR